MDKAGAKKRAELLRNKIDEYRYRYHVLDDPAITDEVYDSLTRELRQIEEEYPELQTPDSPTQRVGGEPLDKFRSVPHEAPMLSLNDVKSREEVEAWDKRIRKLLPESTDFTYHMDIKMDGLACALIYENGIFAMALTRGDGKVGEDVTKNIKTIRSVPLRLRKSKDVPGEFYKGRLEIRGEILMYKEDFEKLNKDREEKGLPAFMNPRNTAAGTVRQLDPKLVAKRPLKFHAYSLIHNQAKTQEEEYNFARELGFIVNRQHKAVGSLDEIMEEIDKWSERRHELPFNTDGLVVAVNEKDIFSRLGVVGKAPRGAIAYKYPPEQATTKLKDIFISIGRTGAVTPVAVLEPVVVAGTLVQMATLHNEGEVHRKGVKIGDTVVVHKAGDIIPEVVEPLKDLRDGGEKKFVMPKLCPECNTELTKIRAEDAVWRCPNTRCPARVHNQIEHFAAKGALDIEGLGEKNVVALLEAGLIEDAADLYALKKEDIIKLERFAEISADNLVNAIKEKKNPPLARFIFALGIRQVGSQTAVDLANHFRTLDNLQKATVEELTEIDGIGEVVAESIVAWFADPQNERLLEKFNEHGVRPKEVKRVGGKLTGKSFVVTGTLDSMSREEAAEKIRSLGGTFQSSVSKDTTYVVVGEAPGNAKIKAAEKNGIEQIGEEELLKLL